MSRFVSVWTAVVVIPLAAQPSETGLKGCVHSNAASELLSAAYGGNLKRARMLLSAQPDVVNAARPEEPWVGATALHLAAERGHLDVAALLLCNGAKIDARDEIGYTALHYAVRQAHMEVVDLLLSKGANANARNNLGTALHVAQQPQIVQALINHGADVDAVIEDGRTPLVNMIENGEDGAAAVLIRNGADVNKKWRGTTMLDLAVLNDRRRIAQLLVSHGADVGLVASVYLGRYESVAEQGELAQDRLVARLRDPHLIRPLTLLDIAARNGDVAMAKLLRMHGLQIASPAGRDAVGLAVKYGHLEMTEFLLQAGAPVGDLVLGAVLQSDARLLELVLSHGGQVNHRTFLRMLGAEGTPMHAAVLMNDCGAVKLLVDGGADVNMRTDDGRCPLYLCQPPEGLEAALLLRENGAQVGVLSASMWGWADELKRMLECDRTLVGRVDGHSRIDGWRPLHWAVYHDRRDAVAVLISAGADVNAADTEGNTALFYASSGPVAEMLLEHNAIPNMRNGFGETALHHVGSLTDCAKLLLSYGADVDARDEEGRTPLHVVSGEGELGVARLLIAHGADVNARSNDGSTPLHLAAERHRAQLIRLLLARGAEANVPDRRGDTPMHRLVPSFPTPTIDREAVAVATLLVNAGANIRAKNQRGLTTYALAIDHCADALADFLRSVGPVAVRGTSADVALR